MSGIGEASLVLGLISSVIAVIEVAHDIYEAAGDDVGLPKKFRAAADKIPLVNHALGLAEKNIKAKNVSEESLSSAKPVLERCKEHAVSLKEIFDKTVPSKEASKSERYKKAVGIRLKSSKVMEHMEEIVKSMDLLAQNQVFQDAETMQDIKDAIEQISHVSDEESLPQFVHSGTGAINANVGGGIQKNYNNSGHGTQYNADHQVFGPVKVKNQIIEHYQYHSHLESSPIVQRLPYAEGATFNDYAQDHVTCHPGTRVDLLSQIQHWAQQPHSKCIFWLNGMAGTGKSTISLTIAKWLAEQRNIRNVTLGASFFFKRNEGDRGTALRFFPTIAKQLTLKVDGLADAIAKFVESPQSISNKSLEEQFDRLLFQPLQDLNVKNTTGVALVVVVDALDECEREADMEGILRLWFRLSQIKTVSLQLFLTTRPELPIRLGFKETSADAYENVVLQTAVPLKIIQRDLYVYLRDKLSKIAQRYNNDSPSELSLSNEWPGSENLHRLVEMAKPLFIVATTFLRFIDEPAWTPQERLGEILISQNTGELSGMQQIYSTILRQLKATWKHPHEERRLNEEFQTVIGSIIVLAEPLSIKDLSILLRTSPQQILKRLNMLHSVFQVPIELQTPVRILHQSFPEYLLSETLQDQPFKIDGANKHLALKEYCLTLLDSPSGLRENICDLAYPGQLRQEVDVQTINTKISSAVQYACRFWVHHVENSKVSIKDDDNVHTFLCRHYLHWLEALSFMNRIAEAISALEILNSLVSITASIRLSSFLEDARRFILKNRYVADLAPLQIYSSAVIFAQKNDLFRHICRKLPNWIQRYPQISKTGNRELQNLGHHSDDVDHASFSRDGSQLMSVSSDQTVLVWEARTSQELQSNRFIETTSAVVFLTKGVLLASVTDKRTIQVWEVRTGKALQHLDNFSRPTLIAFSPNGVLLASASQHNTVRLWEATTGQQLQQLGGHDDLVTAVAISPDEMLLASASKDRTIRIWVVKSGTELWKLAHRPRVNALTFSPDSLLLVSASDDGTLQLWKTTTGELLRNLAGQSNSITAVAFSPIGSWLAAAFDQVRIWDIKAGQKLRSFVKTNGSIINVLAFSHDGSLLASASEDRTIRLWDVTTAQELQILKEYSSYIRALAFSPDGLLLVSVSSARIVRLWEVKPDDKEKQPEGPNGFIRAVKFSPDGSLIASASSDATVRLWKESTGQELKILQGHKGTVYSVMFSPDGLLLASASDEVLLWKVATGDTLQWLKGHTDQVSSLAFSPDSSLLASASDDRTVRVWGTKTGENLQILERHSSRVDAVAFSPTGCTLASASSDRTVRLWNVKTGLELQKMEGHGDWIRALAFSSDGSLLASASDDKTVRLWETRTGKQLQKVDTLPFIQEPFFRDGNKTLYTNRGPINIASESANATVAEFQEYDLVAVHKEWILCNGLKHLWLPHDYRGPSARYGQKVAIGTLRGRVAIFQITDARRVYSS